MPASGDWMSDRTGSSSVVEFGFLHAMWLRSVGLSGLWRAKKEEQEQQCKLIKLALA